MADLAAVAEAVDPADLTDADLVDAVTRWQRVVTAATARQAAVVRELVARTPPQHVQWVSDEIACALATTRRTADRMIDLAVSLNRFPALDDGLLAGRLDARKAHVILDETAGAPRELTAAVVGAASHAAGSLTVPQLRAQVRHTVLRAAPEHAETRCATARAERRVVLEPADDAMAWIKAYLPAEEAVAVFTVLDALADRADTASSSASRARPARPWQQPTTSTPTAAERVDQRRADAFSDVFLAILDSSNGLDGAPLPRRHGMRPAVNVTVAATTLLGLDEVPATIPGYGAIPAPLARRLAQDGTWRRILTDPTDGSVRERGSTTYRPGAALAGTVVQRDETCRFVGCRQPAARCDVDHVVPFDATRPAPPQTTHANLHALCRHHHRAKTHGRWDVELRSDGTALWTSPTGATYARSPAHVHAVWEAFAAHRPPPTVTATDPPPF
ncbi:HNH endonuclease signature motif containing protein [Cellulomonas chitinilytica]|uniref:HNH endonuclease signature motif containing protein n=1 Tax=Cellulomonas chitinilytica TaxID=398759 RepID=UPI00194147FA|nr:HNH endonuclease signature motif containing protein [Cellulomonas chitinilytica]